MFFFENVGIDFSLGILRDFYLFMRSEILMIFYNCFFFLDRVSLIIRFDFRVVDMCKNTFFFDFLNVFLFVYFCKLSEFFCRRVMWRKDERRRGEGFSESEVFGLWRVLFGISLDD